MKRKRSFSAEERLNKGCKFWQTPDSKQKYINEQYTLFYVTYLVFQNAVLISPNTLRLREKNHDNNYDKNNQEQWK